MMVRRIAHQHFYRSRCDASSENQRQPSGLSDGNDRTDKRETRALHTKKPAAHRSQLSTLNESGQAGDEQRHRHKKARRGKIHIKSLGNDERWCDDGNKDSQQMLHGCKESFS